MSADSTWKVTGAWAERGMTNVEPFISKEPCRRFELKSTCHTTAFAGAANQSIAATAKPNLDFMNRPPAVCSFTEPNRQAQADFLPAIGGIIGFFRKWICLLTPRALQGGIAASS